MKPVRWAETALMVAVHYVLLVVGLVMQLVLVLVALGIILAPLMWLVRLLTGAGQ